MKIKFKSKDKNRRLWNQSPCTLRNSKHNTIIDKANRFSYGSIYYKDEVNRPKKIFTQFQRPQILPMNFRRQIEDVTLRAQKAINNRLVPSSFERKMRAKLSLSKTQNSVYTKPEKLQLKYDRFGNRSSYLGDYNVKDIKKRVSQARSNFYSSSRIDLSRPINFNPGPGSYFIDGKMKQFRHTYTQRTISKARSASFNK